MSNDIDIIHDIAFDCHIDECVIAAKESDSIISIVLGCHTEVVVVFVVIVVQKQSNIVQSCREHQHILDDMLNHFPQKQ